MNLIEVFFNIGEEVIVNQRFDMAISKAISCPEKSGSFQSKLLWKCEIVIAVK